MLWPFINTRGENSWRKQKLRQEWWKVTSEKVVAVLLSVSAVKGSETSWGCHSIFLRGGAVAGSGAV